MAAKKLFLGRQLAALRQERGLTQAALSQLLGLSASYLNQLENNQRPMTANVLVNLAQAFDIDIASFSQDDSGRIVQDLREAMADPTFQGSSPAPAELHDIAMQSPRFAQAFLGLHRAYKQLQERVQTMAETLSTGELDRAVDRPIFPYEEVRDYFHYRNNYVDELDQAAERLSIEEGFAGRDVSGALEAYLARRYGVAVRTEEPDSLGGLTRRFDPESKTLSLLSTLNAPSCAFLMAHQIALLDFAETLDELIERSDLQSAAGKAVCRVALANYAAGALMLPYDRFLAAARETLHDVELLQKRFGASFEQVCHRLSTLQRPGSPGVPFYFVRVDRAGNITKRHSATRFQFARFGGACPLWNVHEAFTAPGKVFVQVAEMPDGLRYLCIARGVVKRGGGYLLPDRHYAIGLGCELSHAGQIVYSRGLNLDADEAVAPIGVSCRICERVNCSQRAFPPIDRRLSDATAIGRFVAYQFPKLAQ
ncbi:MAG: short-chain fatty acyl-CoA regulator family protein [Pseudomonadota bacterium]